MTAAQRVGDLSRQRAGLRFHRHAHAAARGQHMDVERMNPARHGSGHRRDARAAGYGERHAVPEQRDEVTGGGASGLTQHVGIGIGVPGHDAHAPHVQRAGERALQRGDAVHGLRQLAQRGQKGHALFGHRHSRLADGQIAVVL